MKKSTLINKSDVMKCWSCDGEGSRIINENHPVVREKCTVCNGTGEWVETHYILVDEVNKIAIDSDTGS